MKRDKNIIKVMTQYGLLTKNGMGSPSKAVNVISSKSIKAYDYDEEESLNEDIYFLSNQMGGSHLPIEGMVEIKVWRNWIMIVKRISIIEIVIEIGIEEIRTEILIEYNQYVPSHGGSKGKESSSINL